MAREYARIVVRIWEDPEFRALAAVEQAVFFQLISNPDLSYCGIADYVPERYIGLASDMTKRRLVAALEKLAEQRFVVIDERTAEILVRSYVRHDGILKQPNVAKAMVNALRRVHSQALRASIVTELIRAKQDDPDAKGWLGVRSLDDELYSEICSKASLVGSVNP